MSDDRIRDLEAELQTVREALRRAEARARGAGELEALVEGLPVLLFLFDADDRYLDYRAGRAQDLYVPPESFIGRRIDEVLPPALGRRLRELMAQARATGAQASVEYALETPAGLQHFEGRIVPLADGRVAALATDVTDRKRAEDVLRESEERFRLGFAHAPIGMALVGLDETLLDVNQALCDMLGYPRDRLIGMTVPQVTHPDDLAAEAERKAPVVEGSRPSFQMLKRYRHADGRVVWGQLSVSAVRDRDGRPRYLIGQLEDVTERVAAEEALRRSEERFRALLERATDMLVVLGDDGRVQLWSPGAAEALGWTSQEVVGTSGLDLLHPDDVASARAALADAVARPGAALRLAFRTRRRDGAWRLVDAVARNLLDDAAVRGIVLNARDVTEQRRLEESFQQSQRLESVGRLAGGVAHDFNNLLTVILSCAEGIERGLRAGGVDLQDVDEIRTAAERARDLTRQLLAFARRQVIDPRPTDLSALVRDAGKLLRRVLGEDVELAVRLGDGLWPVRCDPAQLQQVLLNLAVNARDAMPRGGRLAIESANVELEAGEVAALPNLQPGAHVRLAVTDSGPGLSPEAQAHLFEPFFTTKPAGQGTGLGLATVYGIVRQSGGAIRVESAAGRGTTFELYFPRCDAAPAATASGARAGAGAVRGGRETVLVVEDDPRVREVTVRALAGAGYRVLAAEGGARALELAPPEERLDLLVTDVVMPGMSGPQMAEALARARPGLRVLYVSGYAEDAIVHHGIIDSGIDLLAKPYTPALLLARVRQVLDR